MGKKIQKIGKYFSSIIVKNIAFFLAAGILTILFSGNGWMPNENMERFTLMLQDIVLPLMLSYTAGKKAGGDMGGIAGIMAGTGLLRQGMGSVIGSVLFGTFAGYTAAWLYKKLESHTRMGFEMLTRNLFAGITGAAFLMLSYYAGIPLLTGAGGILLKPIDFMVERQILPLANIFIEPGKVFFLNNGINHGLLIPLGMKQAEQAGKSILFLLETNPGPGLGVLFAYYLRRPGQRKAVSSCMAVHFIGGIHEVYFPYILSELKLIGAVTAGGVAGSLCFQLLGAGTAGPVSPGSILTLFLMGTPDTWPGILAGTAASAAAAGVAAYGILGPERAAVLKENREEEKMTCSRIYFVCDAGVGSSAMGAAMLRRKLKENGIGDITVSAVPVDEIPADAQLLVCQRSFRERLSEAAGSVRIYEVDGLVNTQEYDRLIEQLKAGREG